MCGFRSAESHGVGDNCSTCVVGTTARDHVPVWHSLGCDLGGEKGVSQKIHGTVVWVVTTSGRRLQKGPLQSIWVTRKA